MRYAAPDSLVNIAQFQKSKAGLKTRIAPPSERRLLPASST
jgi:hypothetical protein